MNRKRLFFHVAILLASVLGIIGILRLSPKGKNRLSERMILDGDMNGILYERTEKEGLLSSILADGSDLFIDQQARRIYYSIPENSFEYYDPVLSIPAGLKLVAVGEGITSESIAQNKPVSLLVYSKDSFCWYDLVTTTLPIVSIQSTVGPKWDDRAMQFSLFDNRRGLDSKERLFHCYGLWHVRGRTNKMLPKQSFLVKLKRETGGEKYSVSLLGMPASEEWVLYAPYNDAEKVRNVFSHWIWDESCGEDNSFHIRTGQKYAFVELLVDGAYYGIYALGTKPSAEQAELRMTEGGRESLFYKYESDQDSNETDPGDAFSRARSSWELKGVPAGSQTGGTEDVWEDLRRFYDVLEDASTDENTLLEAADLRNPWPICILLSSMTGMGCEPSIFPGILISHGAIPGMRHS